MKNQKNRSKNFSRFPVVSFIPSFWFQPISVLPNPSLRSRANGSSVAMNPTFGYKNKCRGDLVTKKTYGRGVEMTMQRQSEKVVYMQGETLCEVSS